MPTLASVTPPVPPMMIMSAGMLMNEAGLVPSIIELSIREPKATRIPMAVEAFIAPVHRPLPAILQSCRAGVHELLIPARRPADPGWVDAVRRAVSRDPLGRLVLDRRQACVLAVDGRRRGRLRRATVAQRVAQHRGAVGMHRGGNLIGRLRDDHLRAGCERDDRVGRRLDRHDHVGIQLERLIAVAEPVERDHRYTPSQDNISLVAGRRFSRDPTTGSSELSLLSGAVLSRRLGLTAWRLRAEGSAYWTIVTRAPSISFAVVITRELDWKPRSAVIMLVISVARSTFDISSSPPIVAPNPAVSGVPMIGAPELEVAAHSDPPRRSSPSSLGKVASERYTAVTRFW